MWDLGHGGLRLYHTPWKTAEGGARAGLRLEALTASRFVSSSSALYCATVVFMTSFMMDGRMRSSYWTPNLRYSSVRVLSLFVISPCRLLSPESSGRCRIRTPTYQRLQRVLRRRDRASAPSPAERISQTVSDQGARRRPVVAPVPDQGGAEFLQRRNGAGAG